MTWQAPSLPCGGLRSATPASWCHFHVQVLGDTDDLPFPNSCLAAPSKLSRNADGHIGVHVGGTLSRRWRQHVFAETER